MLSNFNESQCSLLSTNSIIKFSSSIILEKYINMTKFINVHLSPSNILFESSGMLRKYWYIIDVYCYTTLRVFPE
jgi:hypothetical protein